MSRALVTLVWAGAACAIVLPMIGRVARAAGWLDQPNARSSHRHPTPRLGGFAILTGMAVALLATGTVGRLPASLLLGLGIVFVIGLLDDLFSLPVAPRLAAQLVVATAWVVTLRSHLLPAEAWFVLAGPLLVLWLAGFLNVFNFMDGINGIAGLTAVAAAGTYAVALAPHDPSWASLAVAVVGATIAFLVPNLRGSLFMGDGGSGLLGLALAALAARTTVVVSILPAALPLVPFLLDGSLTLWRRWRRGERLTDAHREHLYQRLVGRGWAHLPVAAIWAGLAFTGGVLALAAPRLAAPQRWLLIGLWLSAQGLGATAIVATDRPSTRARA